MKKVLAMIMAATMVMSMTACTGEKETIENSTPTEATTEAATEEPTEATNEVIEEPPVEEETDAPADGNGEDGETAVSGDTLGETLLADFTERAANEAATAQEIADGLMTNPAILFGPVTMPVEQGLLTGFGNTEITGFKEGVTFAPMIGSIAFVGYVFDLEEGTDVAAFMQTLKDNADPRWNICVEAEETVCEQVGNKVFFVMCPKSLEG
ncbi:MAG: hypothetical protein IKV85_05515 [Ruminococcus sp.]|nr:hypothetical protein [Ruminococcus sp.]